jgi:putative IMPACT (imprinted ancient) family translation regulator
LLVPACQAEAELREKGSRFLGVAARVADEARAASLVAALEKRHADASHVCYAWRLDEDRWRTGDAGEPHGTAGPPILDAIRERDLHQAAVVVVRWFGGVKLGKGGLARAYRETARLALEAAGSTEVADTVQVSFGVAPACAGRVPSTVARHAGTVDEERWDGDTVQFRVTVPRERVRELHDGLRDATAGGVTGWKT